MKKYRITTSRWDMEPTQRCFKFKNDKEALKEFEKWCKDERHKWDSIDLERIDQEEKTTRLVSSPYTTRLFMSLL